MILKGRQRGSGADIAVHLMNALDNESVEIAEVRGAVADDLFGAFAEFELVAKGTRAQKPFYSLAINPSEPLTREQYFEAIELIEKRLGFSGQPRAVVFHKKRGETGDAREHCHVVWSRIDCEQMKAIHLSHDKCKLMDLACQIAHRFGLDLPPGLKAWEERQPFKKDQLEASLAEKAQADKTGITPEQRRAEITACYENSDSAAAFVNALEQAGYVLARGDKRGFVVVDRFGSPHSLTRYIKGHSAKQVKAKLAALDSGALPDVDQAKEIMRARMQALEERQQEQQHQQHDDDQHRQQQFDALRAKQQARRTELAGREQDLLARQQAERMQLHAAQYLEAQSVLYRIRKVVTEFIETTPGLRSVLGPIQKLAGLDPAEKHRLENAALAGRQARERMDIARHKRALSRLENREKASLAKRLKRAERQEQAFQPDVARKDVQFDELHGQAQDHSYESRWYEWGELSAHFNVQASGHGDNGTGGDDDGGFDHQPDPNGPDDDGPKRRRKRSYGYRRDD